MEPWFDEDERLLRERRPQPSADFVRTLEGRLLAGTRRHDRFRVVTAAGALGASLAGLTLLLGVLGLLPWSQGSTHGAEAGSRCKTVFTERIERRPVLVVGRDGQLRAESRAVVVRRPVKRCPEAPR
jgi:hypothetical protein